MKTVATVQVAQVIGPHVRTGIVVTMTATACQAGIRMKTMISNAIHSSQCACGEILHKTMQMWRNTLQLCAKKAVPLQIFALFLTAKIPKTTLDS
jgi:hypothetical protein